MPWAGTELAEVAAWNPIAGAVVGDYIVGVNGGGTLPSGALLPTGSFTVFHVPSETARAFSGLSTQTYDPDSVMTLGSYAYARARGSSGTLRDLRQIDPITGAVTILNGTAGGSGPMGVALGSTLWFIYNGSTTLHRYTTAGVLTATTPGWSTDTTGIATDGTYVYVSTGTGMYVLDSSGTVVTTVAGVPSGYGIGIASGGRVYWQANSGVLFFDTSTYAWGVFASTGAAFEGSLVAGADGWFYGMISGGSMAAVNPATGDRVDDTLPTSLSRPGRLFSAGGHIWRPYGDPVS